jgi:phi13 family phage major tail protein
MPTPATAPEVASTIGLKNMVIAPLLTDTEAGTTYSDLQRVAGAIEASVTPNSADPDIQYFDDIEGDVLYPDPEIAFRMRLADLPLAIQEMIYGHTIDENGVLVRNANDKPGYFAIGFASEKANHTMRYVWLYKVRAKPVTENYATKAGGTLTRQTGEVEWTAIKRTSDGQYQAVADEGENGFDATKGAEFLSSVYEPNFVSGG